MKHNSLFYEQHQIICNTAGAFGARRRCGACGCQPVQALLNSQMAQLAVDETQQVLLVHARAVMHVSVHLHRHDCTSDCLSCSCIVQQHAKVMHMTVHMHRHDCIISHLIWT